MDDPRRKELLHRCEELCDHCRAGNVPAEMVSSLDVWRDDCNTRHQARYSWVHITADGMTVRCAAGDVRDQMEGA